MTPPAIANAGSAQSFVLVHAICALALVGATTHHAVVAAGYLRGRFRVGLGRIYAVVAASLWVVTVGLGLLAYPSYRYFVRGLYLDWHRVWASNLFDVKENLAVLGLPLAVFVLLLSRGLDPKRDRAFVGPYAALVFLCCGLAWFAAVSGLLVTLQRGVP